MFEKRLAVDYGGPAFLFRDPKDGWIAIVGLWLDAEESLILVIVKSSESHCADIEFVDRFAVEAKASVFPDGHSRPVKILLLGKFVQCHFRLPPL